MGAPADAGDETCGAAVEKPAAVVSVALVLDDGAVVALAVDALVAGVDVPALIAQPAASAAIALIVPTERARSQRTRKNGALM